MKIHFSSQLRFPALFRALCLALFVCAFACVQSASAQTRRKLIVWGLQPGSETKGLDAMLAEFNKRNPDIEVSPLAMGAGGMNPQKLMTAIVGGAAPDVILQDRFTIGDWASRDAFLPLDDFLKREAKLPDGIKEADFYPAAWREAVYQGKTYAIPRDIDDRMLLYNRKAFREAGLDPNKPPRTWEELEEYALKLTKRRADGTIERLGFIPNYGNSWLYLYSWQNGGEFMDPSGRICTMDNPYTTASLAYMRKLYDGLGGYEKVNVFQSSFQSNEQDPFYKGQVAMVINGNWVLSSIARYAPGLDFAVAPPPVPKERLESVQSGKGRFAGQSPYVTWTGGFAYAIPRNARNTEQAWRFVKWMTSLEATRMQNRADSAYNKSRGRPFVFNFTARPEINQVLLKEFPPGSPRLIAAQKGFLDLLPAAKYRPVTFIGQTLWDAHVRAFEQASAHQQEPKAALTEGRLLVQKELDKSFARENLPDFSFARPIAILSILALAGLAFGGMQIKRAVGHSRMARADAVAGYLMASPWIIGFVLLTGGPILASLVFAFCDYDVLHQPRFVGASNFQELLGEDRDLLMKALGNAAYLSIIGIPLGMSTGLAIAMLLNMNVKGLNWYRTAFYIPSIVPGVASAVLWQWILAGDANRGLLNALWQATLTPWFGWAPPGWFGVAEWAKPGLIVQGLWGAGGGMILWLAGLQGISRGLYEAAQIDGARGWAQFRHITLPMLSPYIFFNLIMGTIGSLQEFDRVYILAGGTGGNGPLDSLLVPMLFLFNNAFRYFKMGYASAIAWILFVLILALTLIQWQAQKYWVHYETDAK